MAKSKSKLANAVPPKARLMLSASVLIVVVVVVVMMGSMGGDMPTSSNERGEASLDLNPHEAQIGRDLPGVAPIVPEDSEIARISAQENERALAEAMSSKDISLTESIRIPATGSAQTGSGAGSGPSYLSRASERQRAADANAQAGAGSGSGSGSRRDGSLDDLDQNRVQAILNQRREQQRQAQNAQQAADAANAASAAAASGSGSRSAQSAGFDRAAFMEQELRRIEPHLSSFAPGVDALRSDAEAPRLQGSARGSGRGRSGAEGGAHNEPASASTRTSQPESSATGASRYLRNYQAPSAPPKPANTVAERLAHYRDVMADAGETADSVDLARLTAPPGQRASEPSSQASDGPPGRVIPAGSILYAVLDTAVNSDSTTYVRATIIQEGPYKGATALGQVTLSGEKVVLQFNSLGLGSRDFSLSAVAVDPDSTQTAIADKVDRHLLERYGMLFGAAFIEGFAEAMSDTATVVNSDGSSTTTRASLPNSRDQAIVATGKVGERLAPIMENRFGRNPTVHVGSGRPIGLMLLEGLPY